MIRPAFEELASSQTAVGVIRLRRRHDPVLDTEVYEVKLGDEFLMSSSFTVAEVELARLGLDAHGGSDLDVVVGGLGLGYTALAVLDDHRVRSLVVVEALEAVIDWHERGLVPASSELTSDERTRLVPGDFFEMTRRDEGFDPDEPGRRFDVALVDIDHSPQRVLDPSHADLYTVDGLRRLASHLRPGGVFALWSDDPPDPSFTETLDDVFGRSQGHVVTFPNPYTGGESSNTVYVAGRHLTG